MTDHPLTFAALRRANILRLPTFKNGKGEPAHSTPDGSDWCLAQWCNAVCGELGEAANLIKKIERGDFTLGEAREDLGKELADVVTYLDILAMRAGIDLGEATESKFNEVSRRVGSPVFLVSIPPLTKNPDRDRARIDAIREIAARYATALVREREAEEVLSRLQNKIAAMKEPDGDPFDAGVYQGWQAAGEEISRRP